MTWFGHGKMILTTYKTVVHPRVDTATRNVSGLPYGATPFRGLNGEERCPA
jgi:hypothetical protein